MAAVAGLRRRLVGPHVRVARQAARARCGSPLLGGSSCRCHVRRWRAARRGCAGCGRSCTAAVTRGRAVHAGDGSWRTRGDRRRDDARPVSCGSSRILQPADARHRVARDRWCTADVQPARSRALSRGSCRTREDRRARGPCRGDNPSRPRGRARSKPPLALTRGSARIRMDPRAS